MGAAGFTALLQPASVVTYRKVRPLRVGDLPIFVARRHDEASLKSCEHIDAKWGIRCRVDRWHEGHRDEALAGTCFDARAAPPADAAEAASGAEDDAASGTEDVEASSGSGG